MTDKNEMTEALRVFGVHKAQSGFPCDCRYCQFAFGYLLHVEQTKALLEAADRMAAEFDAAIEHLFGSNRVGQGPTIAAYRALRSKAEGNARTIEVLPSLRGAAAVITKQSVVLLQQRGGM